MERREAMFLTAGFFGTVLIGSEVFLAGCTRKPRNQALFSESDLFLLDEIGEVILPETKDSPGAKEAHIGQFIMDIVTDCYDEGEQMIFKNGLLELNQNSHDKFGADFMNINSKEKHDLIVGLDQEIRKGFDKTEPHYFQMIKELTLWGYFTSEPGATKALRYNPIPGKYLGCIPYENDDKAWAT